MLLFFQYGHKCLRKRGYRTGREQERLDWLDCAGSTCPGPITGHGAARAAPRSRWPWPRTETNRSGTALRGATAAAKRPEDYALLGKGMANGAGGVRRREKCCQRCWPPLPAALPRTAPHCNGEVGARNPHRVPPGLLGIRKPDRSV